MNLTESEKTKFNEKWWSLLEHHFSENYMRDIYLRLMSDTTKGYKVSPKSNDIYQRFKLLKPEDVRVVFLTVNPITMYEQSKEWQLMSGWIERECYNGLKLSVEDNMDYLIKDGVIHLSPDLTICDKVKHNDIGWDKFTNSIFKILLNETSNRKLFVVSKNDIKHLLTLPNATNHDWLAFEDGCIGVINKWMFQQYNTKINW